MSMPGFTAETSLYKTRGRYRAVAGAPNAKVGSQVVLPQLPIGFCMADCDDSFEWGTLENSICKFNCMSDGSSGGDGGGGGGGSGPNLLCGRCLAQCNKKPPSQRAACRQLCEDSVC
jgi:hypothetical protein